MDTEHELDILIRAKYPIVYLLSWEERRVEEAITRVCSELNRNLHIWSVTQGLRPQVNRASSTSSLSGELEVLAQMHEAPEYTVFVLRDYHPYMKDVRVIRLLRDLARRLRGKAQTLIILSPSLVLPMELEKDITVLDFAFPSIAKSKKWSIRRSMRLKTTTKLRAR